ncbi:MAG: DUF87 domain-containing protein [Desulfurococcaceae archaeon]
MKVLSKVVSLLSTIEPSVMLSGVKKVEIEPPDLVIYKSNDVLLARFLVCREVDYSVHEFSEGALKELVESYIALLNSLPQGVHLHLVKEELDTSGLLHRIANEILNVQADLHNVLEESTKVRLNIKLDRLKALYTALLDGKPFTRISLVVSYRVKSRNKDSAKSVADYYESLIVSSFSKHYGLRLSRAVRNDIVQILLSTIGLMDKPSISKVEVEVERIAYMQPMNVDEAPSLDRLIILGFEKTSSHPVGVKIEDLYRHVAIIGPTGRGKTTLLSSIIEQIVAENLVNVVVMDFKGDLKKYLPGKVLDSLTPDKAPINILEKPAEMENADWRALVVEALAYASGASREAVLKALLTIESEGKRGFINHYHVSVLLPFIEFLRNRADHSLLISQLGKSTLVDVGGYGTVFQNAYVSMCIGLIRYLLLNKKEKLQMILAIDDAWRILQLKTLTEIVREGRSKELGVIISTQSPGDLPDEIAENTYNVVLFGSRSKEYLEKAEKLIGVKGDLATLLTKLSIGEALYVNALKKEVKVIKTYPPTTLRNTYQASRSSS